MALCDDTCVALIVWKFGVVELGSIKVWLEGDLSVVEAVIWVSGEETIPAVAGVDVGVHCFLIHVHQRSKEMIRPVCQGWERLMVQVLGRTWGQLEVEDERLAVVGS